MTIRSILPLALAFSACAVLAGCDGDSPSGPAPERPTSGTYVATRLVVEQETGTLDLLEEGFSIRLELREDGTTGGNFHFAYAEEPGDPPNDVPLTGTWRVESQDGRRVVVIDQPDADTFLRDTPFTFSADRLTGSYRELHAELRLQ
jgi:hypothetical protein